MRRHPIAKALSVAAAATLITTGLTSCAVEGLAFRADPRLTISTPADRSSVVTPFEVAWTLADPRPDELSFAVLVDIGPPRPGAPITNLLPAHLRDAKACDDRCQRDALQALGVTLTVSPSVTVDALPRPGGLSAERARRHRITVIPLDAQGRRSGEVSASVDVDEDFS